MDLEAMQFLNLSPIPELSEIELSTMLDHLSSLSDINGDLTDRNVEDIIKEAEDLIDRSIRSQTNDSEKVTKSLDMKGQAPNDISQDVNSLKEAEKCNSQQSDFDESKQIINTVNDLPQSTSSDDNCNKHFNSPVESTKSKIYSPGGSTNPIKSTIDSLKEFSSLVKQKLNSQSLNTSPKQNKVTDQKKKELDSTEVAVIDTQLKENLDCTTQVSHSFKIAQSPGLTSKENESLNKSIRYLNCFERLYRVKPARLSLNKKPKVVDKMPKTGSRRKLTKDLKNIKKNDCQGKPSVKKPVQVEEAKKVKSHARNLEQERFTEEENLLKYNSSRVKYLLGNFNNLQVKEKKTVDEHMTARSLDHGFHSNDNKLVQSNIDEKLILKVLEEMEEIKDQVRKVEVLSNCQNLEKKMKENSGVIEKMTAKIESSEEEVPPEKVKNVGIKRLEKQFSMLKEKYEYQMEKLEIENFRLREALNNQKKIDTNTISAIAELAVPTETKLFFPFGYSADQKIIRSASLENCKAPKNTPYSSQENINTTATQREAFSQTENESKTIIYECKGVETEEIGDVIEEKKAENKENIARRKKPGKCKPFSDVNVQQLMKQKKTFDHESQLLATLRGLQAEVTTKDKENRKLKAEIESLKKQVKKTTNIKGENFRKYHVGTQTIGFGPFVQKPYKPENYEVPAEFEKENEDLRSRIKALEEDFELLKEKRISDLQALHQVHEEEMAKLVSKLETQSALTRHLHSLLVNR